MCVCVCERERERRGLLEHSVCACVYMVGYVILVMSSCCSSRIAIQ